MISQDHLEVFINIAEYDQEYEKYLTDGPRPPTPPKFDLTIRPGAPHSQDAGAAQPPRPATPALSGKASSSGGAPDTPSRSTPKKLADKFKRIARRGGKKEDTAKDNNSKAPPDQIPQDGSRLAPGFLTMESYGPWSVNNHADLQNLCQVLIALSLYLSK